jgi:uncharacterized protein (TIGR02996 family)
MAGSSFGAILRRKREEGGWARRDLAGAAGLGEATVRDYEQGKRSPSFEAVCRLAAAIGCPIADFAAGVNTQDVHLMPRSPRREAEAEARVMLDRRKAFEAELAAKPADRTLRLVYADWLDEQGDEVAASVQRAIAEEVGTKGRTRKKSE